ncbi:DUF3626 domain-containing protein [Streptosporangium sp. NBC_01756]|uniref:DUF3626 domain-containing protein n=1 Tax=Streptosporangium sp. NBC_01756 TaxID=2975950 RepID=UPI002DDAA954|nr:DUF3626 domain-containing protein [Streptosporangium sp. NBC_01756]WSC90698.1 DUF3626 domain-containing protein [Streptosporangium sp. NBC_01756]
MGEPAILERLAKDGAYLSQFVTGTGNGGLTAHPGGDRWRWESRIFGSAYDDVPARQGRAVPEAQAACCFAKRSVPTSA